MTLPSAYTNRPSRRLHLSESFIAVPSVARSMSSSSLNDEMGGFDAGVCNRGRLNGGAESVISGSKYCGFSDRNGVSEEDGVHVRGWACQLSADTSKLTSTRDGPANAA